ncbi:MAG: hypothetical protein SF029_18575 [bacterium]|nr:hypothetical protein [bacterium]
MKQTVLGRWAVLIVLGVLAVACQPTAQSTPAPTEVALVKLLATLAPTTTPDPNIQQPTAAPAFVGIDPTATLLPTATAYVGVFLGETQEQLGGEAVERELPNPDANADEPLLCLTLPDAVFGTGWINQDAVRTNLNCPIQQSFGFEGRIQVFERGAIYWRVETNEVWAVAPGRLDERTGQQSTGSYWYVDVAPQFSPAGITPPEGLRLPEGYIGGVWATVPQVREALGYATTDVQDIGVNLQRFEGGTLFADVTVGQVFALLLDGTAYGPFLATSVESGQP